MRLSLFTSIIGCLLLSTQVDASPNTTSRHESSDRKEEFNTPGNVTDFRYKVSDNKVELTWTLQKNHTADRLVIQKSKDGKTFEMVGLVFGTDKQDSDQYKFHEKIGTRKVSYRIIVIHKDDTVEYSTIVTTSSIKKPRKEKR